MLIVVEYDLCQDLTSASYHILLLKHLHLINCKLTGAWAPSNRNHQQVASLLGFSFSAALHVSINGDNSRTGPQHYLDNLLTTQKLTKHSKN